MPARRPDPAAILRFPRDAGVGPGFSVRPRGGYDKRQEEGMSEANEASLRRAVDAFNDPSARDGYLDLYAPDVVLHGYRPASKAKKGRAASTPNSGPRSRTRASILRKPSPVMTASPLATRSAESKPRISTGRRSSGATKIEGMTWLHFRDGQVVEVWQVSGTPDTLARLSARAAKAPPRHSASADAAALRWEEKHP